MAARKSALKRAPARPDLERLLELARTTRVTDDQLQEQRVSFAYGNAPKGGRSPGIGAICFAQHPRSGKSSVEHQFS